MNVFNFLSLLSLKEITVKMILELICNLIRAGYSEYSCKNRFLRNSFGFDLLAIYVFVEVVSEFVLYISTMLC